MTTLNLDQMAQFEGGSCAAITGTVGGAGFIKVVGGAVVKGASLTWKLGGQGLLVGIGAAALAGTICYGLSYLED